MFQLRSVFALGLVMLLASPASAAVNPATLKRSTSIAAELDFKPPRPPGPPVTRTSRAAQETLSYNGTLVGGLSWDRPISCGPNISGLGPVRYHVQPFAVTLDGIYDLSSLQTFDGYLHLYSELFSPAAGEQLNQCLGANDDGLGGVGTSEILGVTLTAGRQYFLVTSGFRAGDAGTFTNTISGVGTPILGAGGPDVMVTVTPSVSSARPAESFVYTVKVSNNGPGVAVNVRLDLETSPNQTVGANSCTQFPLATLPVGGTVTCELAATLDSCGGASLLAKVEADGVDSPANNQDLSRVNSNLVADEGFEAGTPSPTWLESSTQYSTPLCTAGTCGTGTGSLPSSGNWWAWFGGAVGREEGKLAQSVVIPAGGTAVLELFLEMAVCSGSEADFLEVLVDGEQVFRTDGTSARCGTVGYQLQSLDLSAFADGEAHLIELHSVLDSGENTNFFVNDVTLVSCSRGSQGTDPPAIPTLSGAGLAALLILIGFAAAFTLRRRT